MWSVAGAGLKGGLLAAVSLLLSLRGLRQFGSKFGVGSQEDVAGCVDPEGKPGICVTAVECPQFHDRSSYLTQSTCQLSIFITGVCCPNDNDTDLKDPLEFIGLVMSDERNKSIMFPSSISISKEDLNDACEKALQTMKYRQKLERNLVKQNVVLRRGSPAFWHSKLFQTTQKIYLLGQDGTLVLLASINLVQRFNMEAEEAYGVLTPFLVSNTILKDTCPLSPPCAPSSEGYRSYDGTCNNLLHGEWGSTGLAMRRLMIPFYSDGVSSPRTQRSGLPLPSARLVSSVVHPNSPELFKNFTLLLMLWGQFIDHDVTHTPLTKGAAFTDISCCKDGKYLPTSESHPECYPIKIAKDDPFFTEYGQECMEFVRSMAAVRPDCTFGPREQMNQVTSFLDGSVIYGSSVERANELRTQEGGRLRMSRRGGNNLLPPNRNECQQGDKNFCFKAGDTRVNEQIQLTAMHTLWARHHNLIVDKLSRINRHWTDEKLFQEGKKIVAAQIQHITYNEFLPIVLGGKSMKQFGLLPKRRGYFSGYKDGVDPTILNSFSTAAFRFGHSLITDHFRVYDSNGNLRKNEELIDTFFAPFPLYQKGALEGHLRGTVRQNSRKSDRFFINEVTQKLFATNRQPFGLDLVALNIQRGRDHGLSPYLAWRNYCGLEDADTWDDLLRDMDNVTLSKLKSAYDSLEDVDLFVGGMCERPLQGAIVGPTFHCLLTNQFIRLKIGDRFFYENAPDETYNRGFTGFTPAQLQQIRKTSLARIFCSNGKNIGEIQPMAFLSPNSANERVTCRSGSTIPNINLLPWKEIPQKKSSSKTIDQN